MAIVAAGDTFNYLQGPMPATAQGVAILGGAPTEYPTGTTVLNSSSGNVAAAVATATLTSAASQTAYITGFEVTGAGATAGAVVSVTVTGTIGGTMTYTYTAATGATVANQPLIATFYPPIPASAANTNIVVSCPSLGAGNTNNTVTAHGYRR